MTLHGDIRLNGQDVDLIVGDALGSLDEDLSLVGSSIVRLGLFDPTRKLITSGLLDLHSDDSDRLGREVEMRIDGTYYWLRHVEKQADTLTPTFEDRTVAKLRDDGRPMKVAARVMDDRRFVAALCALAGVPAPITHDPLPREIAARQKVGTTRLRIERDQKSRDDQRKPGIADGAKLTVKGSPITRGQIREATALLSAAADEGATPIATEALVFAGIAESGLGAEPGSFTPNGAGGGRGFYGVLQGNADTWPDPHDTDAMARAFLRGGRGFQSGGAIHLSKTASDPVEIAVRVEVPSIWPSNAYAGEAGYSRFLPEARAIIAAFTGEAGLVPGVSRTVEFTFESPLTVGRDESYWDACVRTADERNARFFVVRNQPYYMYDEALMQARPVIADLSEQDDGVDWIDWEWAPRKKLRKTDVTARAAAWQAPIGSVVTLAADNGPAAGRWLVGAYQRDRTQLTAQITLQKGRKPKIPTETATFTLDGGESPKGLPADFNVAGVPQQVQLALAEAYRISRKNYAYAWGGGHEHAGTASRHQAHSWGGEVVLGFDCSGYTGAQTAAAGLAYAGSSVPGSGDMAANLGLPGEGRWMTVWANGGHVWVEYKLPGGRVVQANTAGGPPDGPHVRPGAQSKAGFTPRHFEGL